MCFVSQACKDSTNLNALVCMNGKNLKRCQNSEALHATSSYIFCDLKSFLFHLATHECLDFQKERNKSCKFKRDKVSPKHKLHHTCRTNHIPQCAAATRAARCSYTGKLGKARVVRVLYPGCAHTNSFKGSHLHPEWVSLDPTEQMCIAVVPPRMPSN